MRNITCRYLAAGRAAALANVEPQICEYLRNLGRENLRRGLDVDFVANTVSKCVSDFEKQAEQLFPHVLEYSPDDTVKYGNEISDSVQQSCDRLFVDHCLQVLVPDIETEIVEQIKNEIASEMVAIPIGDIGVFNFTSLSTQHQCSAETQFYDLMNQIHRGIVSSVGFDQFVGSLRAKILDHVKTIESVRRQEYSEYTEAENERQRNELEEQFQENLKKMSENEAQKQRQLEQEIAEAARRQQESENRHRVEMEQMKAASNVRQAQHEQHIAAMKAAEEKAEADARDLSAKITADRAAAEAERRQRYDQDREIQAQCLANLENTIQQLKNRRPRIIHIYRKRGCQVF
jgi:chemotaxis protein histidine kinase CheA